MEEHGSEVRNKPPDKPTLIPYDYKSLSIESTEWFNYSDTVLEINGVAGRFHIIRFDTVEEANELYNEIMSQSNCHIGLPLRVFRVYDDAECMIAIPKEGITLDAFVRKKEKILLLSDCLKNRVKVRISEMCKKILRDIIEVVIHLKATTQLRCVLQPTTVTLLQDPQQPSHLLVRISDAKIGVEDKMWHELFALMGWIEDKVGKISNAEELSELKDMILDGKIDKSLFNLSVFWDPPKRCDFICKLHSYLEMNQNILFWDEMTDSNYGEFNWKSQFDSVKDLKLFRVQHEKYREKRGVNVNFQGLTEIDLKAENFNFEGLTGIDLQALKAVLELKAKIDLKEADVRMCIDFMRQSIHHFQSMSDSICQREKVRPNVNTKYELQLLFEHAFPNHIKVFADRVQELGIQLF